MISLCLCAIKPHHYTTPPLSFFLKRLKLYPQMASILKLRPQFNDGVNYCKQLQIIPFSHLIIMPLCQSINDNETSHILIISFLSSAVRHLEMRICLFFEGISNNVVIKALYLEPPNLGFLSKSYLCLWTLFPVKICLGCMSIYLESERVRACHIWNKWPKDESPERQYTHICFIEIQT